MRGNPPLVYHIFPARATETSHFYCLGTKVRIDVFWDLNITFRYFVCLKKKPVNSNVLSFSLKLFRTKVNIKSVIKDYSLRNCVVNWSKFLNTCKLSKCSIEISEDPMSHLGSWATSCPTSDARYVNSQNDESLSRTLFDSQ